MNKQYKIGYYYERKVKQILEKDGYLVWRSPASKSSIAVSYTHLTLPTILRV